MQTKISKLVTHSHGSFEGNGQIPVRYFALPQLDDILLDVTREEIKEGSRFVVVWCLVIRIGVEGAGRRLDVKRKAGTTTSAPLLVACGVVTLGKVGHSNAHLNTK